MSEAPIPEKEPQSLLTRLAKLRHQKPEIPAYSDESLDQEVKEKLGACIDKWHELLRWKTPASVKSLGSPSFIRFISLLEPPQHERADLKPEERLQMDSPGVNLLVETLSEFARREDIAYYAPKHVHAILYDRHNDGVLFPKSDVATYGGFHNPFAGYPSIFWPVEIRESGQYGVQPQTLGHEFGEVLVSEIEKRAGNGIRGEGASRHFLKEGLCEAIGFQYYLHAVTKLEGLETGTYDEVARNSPKDSSLERVLDEEMIALSPNEYDFVVYRLAGSLVAALVEKYGLRKVLDYFFAEAVNAVGREERHRKEMGKFKNIPGLTVSFGGRNAPAHVPQYNKLDDLLTELGYTREDFEGATSESKSPDSRPEGSIAAAVYAECVGVIRQHERSKEEEEVRLTGPRKEPRRKSSSFVERAIKSLNTPRADEVFGSDFSAHDFIMSWREKTLLAEK